MTLDTNDSLHTDQVDDLRSPEGLLEILNTEEELIEANQPHRVRTMLSKHQKQALTFMNRREKGWNLTSNATEI